MFRALIIGDVHWRAENPVARLDSYQEALTAKLRECWELARAHDVQAVIQTGDLFDSPTIAQTTMDDLWDVLEECPVPIYTVAGNHDLYGANPETLYRTPLGHLFRRRVVLNAARGPYVNDSGTMAITGHGYDFSTDIDKNQYGLSVDMPERYVAVHVTHGMLLDSKPPTDKMRWTAIDSVAGMPNMPDVLINGHDHQGFGIVWRGNTLFINPGALIRIKADLREIDRPVQVALLSIGDEITAELIPLKSARPGLEVLSREHIIAELEKEQRRERFTDLLTDMKREALDVTAMVDEVARAEAIDEAVRVGALRRIGRAVEKLAGRVA